MGGPTTNLPARLLAFAKLCGAGNDFIALDGEAALAAPGAEAIRRLCDRRYGVGADGLMLLRRVAGAGAGDAAFEVDFYNADGSGGMLCGNGARCALERARILGWIEPGRDARFRFAGRGYRGASIGEGLARFELDPGVRLDGLLELRVGAETIRGRYADVGSVHFVADVGSILGSDGRPAYRGVDEVPMDVLGRAVRRHEAFAPLGVNASVWEANGGRLRVRTFERGVEGETLACGTGSVSCALSAWLDGRVEPPVRVGTRGGDELVVDFGPEPVVSPAAAPRDGRPSAPPRLRSLSLSGPAYQAFEGSVRL